MKDWMKGGAGFMIVILALIVIILYVSLVLYKGGSVGDAIDTLGNVTQTGVQAVRNVSLG